MDNAYGWDEVLNRFGGNSYYWNKKTLERMADERYLDGYGFKVYSQNDEDGILQEIFRRIGTENKQFIEIGVQDGVECNTHYLLHQGWTGVWIEGDEDCYWSVQYKFHNAIRRRLLQVLPEFVTRETIDEILEKCGIDKTPDLLSLDIDGNDYHVLHAIGVVSPRVVVVEYNGKFPPPTQWIMPYRGKYVWDRSDAHGASLSSFAAMMDEKGYGLVGTGLNGVNAFFIRKDLLADKFPYEHSAEHLYNPARLGQGNNTLMFRTGEHWCKYFLKTYETGIVELTPLDIMPFNADMISEYRDKEICIWGGATVEG